MSNRVSPIVKNKAVIEMVEKQQEVFWLPGEIKVEKDVQDILVNMTVAEKHAIITTLKLFTLYEVEAGEEYWGTRFKEMFDEIEYKRMASCFADFELNVHLPFYNKINELLNLDTDSFYQSYLSDDTLSARMTYIDEVVSAKDDLVSLAGFSMVEGAILYSSFAFLKHFQSNGKNKLLNIVRGINFSVRDENLHSEGGAYAFRDLKSRLKLTQDQENKLKTTVYTMATVLFEHEQRIIEMIHEKGDIEGISRHQMESFVKSRINLCLQNLGYEPIFEVKENPIAEWFYKGINNFSFNDFFSGQGNQYNRNWDEEGFSWGKHK